MSRKQKSPVFVGHPVYKYAICKSLKSAMIINFDSSVKRRWLPRLEYHYDYENADVY